MGDDSTERPMESHARGAPVCWDSDWVTVDVRLRWMTTPGQVDPFLLQSLADCWWQVSNAGGAVGFPFLPVAQSEVQEAAVEMVGLLADAHRLLAANVGGSLAGWLLLSKNPSPLSSHWGRVTRVQTHPAYRGQGVGVALMREVARAARDELHLEQLHLELRGGLGLEDFYEGLGWEIVGRWPGALRLGEGEDRDEVLMFLSLA